MRAVKRYSLVSSNRGDHSPVLARDGRALAVVVDGVILEAQFELSDESALIWLTDDSPYDEGLHVYLLSNDGVVEDAVEAGAVFSPGILKIREAGEDWVEFEFFTDGTVYRLEVAREARLRLWLPKSWKYRNKLARHRVVIREVRKGGT